MAQTMEPIEVVIISGPRKGEIVRLSEELFSQVSDEDIHVLNAALDKLIMAMDKLSEEVRVTIESFREVA